MAIENPLARVAACTGRKFRVNVYDLSGMQFSLKKLDIPYAEPRSMQSWFKGVKKFWHVDQLMDIARNGAPVYVESGGNLSAELEYGNYRSVDKYLSNILAKVRTDV